MLNKFNLIEERPDTVTDPLETILFTSVARPNFGKCKPSEILPLYGLIAKVCKYDLNKPIDYLCTQITLQNSVFLS